MNESASIVMAIDPGRTKCGIAVVKKAAAALDACSRSEVLHKSVVPSAEIGAYASDLAAQFTPEIILIGNGTTSAQIAQIIKDLRIARIKIVDEVNTTLLARKRYFKENPPRWFRRLIPTSLQTPPRPYDDYVAVLLAERHFNIK